MKTEQRPGMSTPDPAAELVEMVLVAMRDRKVLTFKYTLADDCAVSASLLAKIEKPLDGLVRALLSAAADQAGLEAPALAEPVFFLDVSKLQHRDDGENRVGVEVDFDRLLPAAEGEP